MHPKTLSTSKSWLACRVHPEDGGASISTSLACAFRMHCLFWIRLLHCSAVGLHEQARRGMGQSHGSRR